MADFSEVEAPLPSIEEFFDTMSDLEVSIGELSIEGKHMWATYFIFTHIWLASFRFGWCIIPVFAVYFKDQGQTSTPKRGRSILKELDAASGTCETEFRPGKHDLTPSSKMAILPNTKRFEVGKRVLSLKTEFVASTGSCINGRFIPSS